jgi:hypothetical protein
MRDQWKHVRKALFSITTLSLFGGGIINTPFLTLIRRLLVSTGHNKYKKKRSMEGSSM